MIRRCLHSAIPGIVTAFALSAFVVPALAQVPSKDGAKDAPKAAAKDAAPDAPLATVNGQVVPRLRAEIMLRGQISRGAKDSDQLRAFVREETINREVIVQEATKAGITRRSDIAQAIDYARSEVIVNAFVQDYVRRNPITDADVQKEYDAAKGQAGEREFRARHILVETEDEAKTIIAALQKGAKFEDLAKSSKDPGTKDRGGDLDWNVPGTFDKVFADAMVKLEKGKLADAPVRTRFGFHVIRLDDVRQLKFPSFADLKPRLQQQIVQRRVGEMVRDLRSKAKVETP